MNEAVSEFNPQSVNKAVAYATRLLAMREYSEKSIKQKIRDKGFAEVETDAAVDYLLTNNWLSDERYCEAFVRSKARKGQGLVRIQYELANQGISPELLEKVLEDCEFDWQSECHLVARKKTASASLQNNIYDRQKLERFLRYRGFSAEQVRKSIKQCLN